ncbi:DUF5681 domain-containing protein [Erythrobacter sp. GH1-10]|uniref:DUF5681 domain-containing protein n=1 Tax=Erythrobacter sp. GH1-10 TaxID=3349334 RepID=UPI00387807EA
MSEVKRKDESNATSEDNNVVPYTVGYGKPPVEHRFKKGQSGNPKGRPKGSTNKPKVDTGYGMRAAEEYLRHEAYRPVTLREDGELIELPAIQAVFRAMGVAAMKGNRFAQKTMAELVRDLEQRDADARFELFGNAVEYKQRWSEEFERCQKHGLPTPEPLPHPDDIILNPSTGEVKIKGPQTKEQKQRLDEALARRAEAQDEVNYFADKYRRARCDKRKAQWLEDWHWEQRMFDILNDIVPDRYKRKLDNRSYREGASKSGSALQDLRNSRAMRDEYVGD